MKYQNKIQIKIILITRVIKNSYQYVYVRTIWFHNCFESLGYILNRCRDDTILFTGYEINLVYIYRNFLVDLNKEF